MAKLFITPWHGEDRSVFYVNIQYSEDESDWGILASFRSERQAKAYIQSRKEAWKKVRAKDGLVRRKGKWRVKHKRKHR